MRTLSVTDAARNFSDVINRVRYQGEVAVLTKGGKEVARLSPMRRPITGGELAAVWRKLRLLSAKESAAMARDVAAGRRSLPPPRSPWG